MASTRQPTMIDPQVADLVKQLVKQQLEILASGSRLSRERKAMGELKKGRDGTIAELTRLEVKLTEIELPFGLATDDQGYVVAEDVPGIDDGDGDDD